MTGFKLFFCSLLLSVAAAAPVYAAEVSVSGNDIPLEVDDQDFLEVPSSSDASVSGNDSGIFSDDPDLYDGLIRSIDSLSDRIDSIEPYSNYDTYYGSISSAYLEYFRGYLSRLGFNDHYVCSRVSQYDYIFAYGDLVFSSGIFSGSDILVVTFNTYNQGTFSSGVQSSFSLNPHSFLVYTDLVSPYPSLATSSDMSLRQIVYFVAILISFYTFTQMMRAGVARSRSRRWKK